MNREAITYVRISKRLDESILNVDKDSMFDFEKTQRMADRLTSIFTNNFRSNSNFYSTSILLHLHFEYKIPTAIYTELRRIVYLHNKMVLYLGMLKKAA